MEETDRTERKSPWSETTDARRRERKNHFQPNHKNLLRTELIVKVDDSVCVAATATTCRAACALTTCARARACALSYELVLDPSLHEPCYTYSREQYKYAFYCMVMVLNSALRPLSPPQGCTRTDSTALRPGRASPGVSRARWCTYNTVCTLRIHTTFDVSTMSGARPRKILDRISRLRNQTTHIHDTTPLTHAMH